MIDAHSHFCKILNTMHHKLPIKCKPYDFCLLTLTLSTYIYWYTSNYELPLYMPCGVSFLYYTEIFLLLPNPPKASEVYL